MTNFEKRTFFKLPDKLSAIVKDIEKKKLKVAHVGGCYYAINKKNIYSSWSIIDLKNQIDNDKNFRK